MFRLLLLTLIVTGLAGAFLLHQWWENRTAPAHEYLFVYGTLTNPLTRFYACRCLPETMAPATLSGYARIPHQRTIVPGTSEDRVSGTILTITPVELRRFDRYERVPQKYRRERVTINEKDVWVYIKQP